VSIEQVARQAGVSVATVSRAFNLPDKVAAGTLARIMVAAEQLAYLPNTSARTLRTQRSEVLGVVLPTLLNPVFAECLDGIAQAATAAGYAILPLTTDYRLEREQAAVDKLLAAGVDGLVLVVSNPGGSTALHKLATQQVPYVLAYNRDPRHPCVGVDGERAVAELVEYLVSLGHGRIAMVAGELQASDRAQQRYRGFQRGAARAGLAQAALIEVPFVEPEAAAIATALRSRSRPTALVCSNDLLAIRCIRAAHGLGLRVPQDLTVVGFDGIALGRELSPMLGTIAQPNASIGACSVELLARAIAAGDVPGSAASVTLPHEFRPGESCAAPAPRPSKRKEKP
jgi:LacI family transcriptional regulator, repressor for deo operon, udp, cdd, tsx, nupC, and nupG